jgi:hypothetical protein
MGLMDKAKEQRAAAEAGRQQVAELARGAVAACPLPSSHYVTEVNKGSINMTTWGIHLNQMYAGGYRLAHSFEQDGNTVQVYEHHFH